MARFFLVLTGGFIGGWIGDIYAAKYAFRVGVGFGLCVAFVLGCLAMILSEVVEIRRRR